MKARVNAVLFFFQCKTAFMRPLLKKHPLFMLCLFVCIAF